MKNKFICAVIAAIMVFSIPLSADFMPYNLQSAMLLKILTFDQNIESNVFNGFMGIGILGEDTKRSKSMSVSMLGELLKAPSIKYGSKDIKLEYSIISFKDEKNLAEIIKQKHIGVLYIAVESPDSVEKILSVTRSLKVLSVLGSTNIGEKVKNGITLGLELEGEKPVILFNPGAAQKEGRSFSKEFLGFAKTLE
jgi:hypothetical protein